MFTQSVKFYTVHCPILKSTDVLFGKGDSSNKQEMNSCSFQQVLRENLRLFFFFFFFFLHNFISI